MSADFITLLIVLFIVIFTIIKRVSAQIVILVLLSSLLVGATFGADIIMFLESVNSIFGTQNAAWTVYMLVVFGPSLATYWHFRGGASYNPVERFLVAVFMALLSLLAFISLFELAGLPNPLRNSYFANQIRSVEGLVVFAAFAAALFEVFSHNHPATIKARRAQRKRSLRNR